MPRQGKKRRVCKEPVNQKFQTQNNVFEHGIIMTVEEYEAIRLMDYLGMTQAECAKSMQVSRATVQAIYAEARKKTARFLVEGMPLEIAGGDYEICADRTCEKINSHRMKAKESNQMKVAVTYENGQVFQHFGHTEQFKVYDVEDGKIVSSEIVDTNGQGHGALAGFLFGGGVDVLICGGIGGGARNALTEAGIQLYPGATGDADEQVASFLAGTLNYDPNTMCNHHGEGHTCGDHEDGHSCGHGEGHGCGNH